MRRPHITLTRVAAAALIASASVLPLTQAPLARADNLWLQACSYYSHLGSAFTFSTNGDVTAWQGSDSCSTPQLDGSLQIDTPHSTTNGRYAQWSTTAPAGISIDSAWTPPCSNGCDRPYRGVLISCNLGNQGYQAYFQWAAGGVSNSQRIVNNDSGGCPYSSPSLADGTPINRSFGGTNFFGWFVSCLSTSGCNPGDSTLYMRGIQLGAIESGSPTLHALGSNNLYYHSQTWIRGGGWGYAFQAGDPSGVCDMRVWLNNALVQGPTAGIDRAVWDQCDPGGATQEWSGQAVDTTSYSNGSSVTLTDQAQNAAGNWSTSATSTTYVDNQPVELNLSGPTSAPATAGTQYVTATATAGPSGVGGIYCSVDGSAWSGSSISGFATEAASASVPVGGLGSHQVTCYATNRASDAAGALATSPMRSWAIRLGEPVHSGITFARIAQRCRRVDGPTHHRKNGKGRGRHHLVCSSRAARDRSRRIKFGRGVTVGGWLATADGAPLSHVAVSIMAAAANHTYHWRRAAVVTTSASGTWTARLHPGPSRLIQAVYRGGPMTQPSTSDTVRTIVPAHVLIDIRPTHAQWGHRIVIFGRVLGGYVPKGSQVLQLRVGIGHIGSVQGNPSIDPRTGRFRFIWQFHTGSGRLNPWFAVATLREADYPYAPAVSRRIVEELR